jgi:hypothetical protein
VLLAKLKSLEAQVAKLTQSLEHEKVGIVRIHYAHTLYTLYSHTVHHTRYYHCTKVSKVQAEAALKDALGEGLLGELQSNIMELQSKLRTEELARKEAEEQVRAVWYSIVAGEGSIVWYGMVAGEGSMVWYGIVAGEGSIV